MKRIRQAFFLIASLRICALGWGEAPPAIPWKHDWERYESSFERNPFTSRTLPEAADVGLADFALVSYYGALENPTLVVANVKTNERFRLKIGEVAPAGFVIRSCRLTGTAEERCVEVTKDGLKSKIKFADAYVRQMAAKSDEQLGKLRQQQENTSQVAARVSAPGLRAPHSPSVPKPTTPAAVGARTLAAAQPAHTFQAGMAASSQTNEQNDGSPVADTGAESAAPPPSSTPARNSEPGRRVLIPPVSQ